MGSQLITPDASTETRRLARFFDEQGLTEQTVLQAVDLIPQRSDVYLRDAVAVAEETGFKSACKAGCGYCCHTLVSVAPPEVFFIARHVEAMEDEAREAFRSRVLAYAERTEGMDGGTRFAEQEPCPFLRPEDWYCGLHTARPLVCRAMHSGSLPACIKAYRERDAYADIPSIRSFFANTTAYLSAYASVFRARGISCYTVELAAALAIIWREENAFARWLGGEDLFAEAAVERLVPEAQTLRRA